MDHLTNIGQGWPESLHPARVLTIEVSFWNVTTTGSLWNIDTSWRLCSCAVGHLKTTLSNTSAYLLGGPDKVPGSHNTDIS